MEDLFYIVLGFLGICLAIFLYWSYSNFESKKAQNLHISESEIKAQVRLLIIVSVLSLVGLFLLTPLSPFYSKQQWGSYQYFNDTIKTPLRIIIRTVLLLILFSATLQGRQLDKSKKTIFNGFKFFGLAAYLLAFLNGCQNINFGWGRPLRVNGKEVEPELGHDSNWISKSILVKSDLEQKTKSALEALWLRDAKKEFASIPAFAKLCWQLAGYGAPPELLKKVKLAGLQEIEHAQLCFSMASAFGEKQWSAISIPEILNEREKATSLNDLIIECFTDGCMMESFNADVAQESLKFVQDEESKKVISIIAREERFHGNLSWEILEFLLSRASTHVHQTLRLELKRFESNSSPEAYPKEIADVVEAGDANWMKFFGRLPKEEFPDLWKKRIACSRDQLDVLLTSKDLGRQKKYSNQSTPEISA